MVAYEKKLKPALRVGTFRFLKEEDFIHWKKIPMQNMVGAEPATDLFTNYKECALFQFCFPHPV